MTTFQNNGKLKLLIIVGTRPEMVRQAHHRLSGWLTTGYPTGSPQVIRLAW